jgi:hypothetical protein
MREVEIRPAGFTSIGGNDYYPQYPSTSRMDAPIPSAEFMQTEENASTYYEQYYRQEENIQPTSSPQGMDTPPPDDPLAYVAKLGELSIAATKKHRDYNNSERGIAKTQRQTDNRRKKPRDDQTNRDYDVRDKDKLLNRYRSQYKPGRDSKVQASLIEAQKYELPVRELTKVGPLLKGVKLNLQALKGNAQANEARREQVINLETDPEGYQGYQGPEQYR